MVTREQLAAIVAASVDGPAPLKDGEAKMPPHPRGVVEMLRAAGHTVVVREKARNTGLAYRLDSERWRSAFELTNRARKLGVL